MSSTVESRIRNNGTNMDCTKTSVCMFKSHRNLKWSSLKEFPNLPLLKQTGQEERVRGKKERREREKEQQAGLNWLNPFRGQQSSPYKCLWLVLTLRHSPGQELEWGKLPKWKVRSPVWDVIRSRLFLFFFLFFVSVFPHSFSRWSLYAAAVLFPSFHVMLLIIHETEKINKCWT